MTAQQKLTEMLTVDAGNPTVDIKVFDGSFRLRASGAGRVEERLPTGFYTVRYSAGDARAETEITLRPGSPVTLTEVPDLPFSSAAPLPLTSTSHEYHQVQARRLSQEDTLAIGQHAHFFLFVRDVDPGGAGNPAQGLTLHRLDGTQIADLADVTRVSDDSQQARCAGRNLALDPGAYLVRLALGSSVAIEMPVHLMEGWQSQLFLLRQGGGFVQDERQLPDLTAATQLMTSPSLGFDPVARVRKRSSDLDPSEDLRLAELARQALAEGQSNISPSEVRRMLDGKWVDPLLGILGLHLLLMGRDPDVLFAESVVGRLRSIVGATRHPDIEILALEIAHRRGAPIEATALGAPPMLRRSWSLLIRLSAIEPQLIKSGTMLDKIAGRLWGSGAWLTWETEPQREKTLLGIVGDVARSVQGWASTPTVLSVLASARSLLRRGGSDDPSLSDIGSRLPFLLKLVNELPNAPVGTLDSQLDKLVPLLRESFPAIKEALEQIAGELGQHLDQVISGPALEQISQKIQLSQSERALLFYLISEVALHQFKKGPSSDPYSLPALVDHLALPASQIAVAAAGLVIKLAGLLARRGEPEPAS